MDGESIENVQPVVKADFVDVAETDRFYESVVYVYDKGLMIGHSETTFSPTSILPAV